MTGVDKTITEKQKETLAKLKEKAISGKITERQKAEYFRLIDLENSNKALFLPESAKTMLRKYVLRSMYGVRYYVKQDYAIDEAVKGSKTESIAIDMVNEVTGGCYRKSGARVENMFLTGKIDASDGPTLDKSTSILEIKTHYELPDFASAVMSPIPQRTYWQAQGYMFITGKESVDLANVLTPHPESTIQQQVEMLQYAKEWATSDYIERAITCMKNDDIPITEKVLMRKIRRNEEHIDKIAKRVNVSWIFMSELELEYKKRFE